MTKAATGALIALLAMAGRSEAAPHDNGGGLVGLVEDSQGAPMAGAVVSVFGRGVGRLGLVTLTDSAGRFSLRSLPAGSYTLRAVGADQLAASARQVTVLPNREARLLLSLAPTNAEILTEQEADEAAAKGPRERELRWLVRHRRRSVLESEGHGPSTEQVASDVAPHASLPFLADLDGRLELMSAPPVLDGAGDIEPSLGALHLSGNFYGGRWALGGLVAESETATWRMAVEFVVEPGGGHEITAGAGYGTRFLRPMVATRPDLDSEGMGALFAQDRWQMDERFAATLGARVAHIGFLADHNHVDPLASLEFAKDGRTKVRGTISAHTVAPGGDILTVSTLGSAQTLGTAFMPRDLRPERATRYAVEVEESLGDTTLQASAFHEGVRSILINSFEPGKTRMLRITNGPGLSTRGMSLGVTRKQGAALRGSVVYTYGHASPEEDGLRRMPGTLAHGNAGFHDVVTRVETFIDDTDTRLIAYYRVNRLSPEHTVAEAATTTTRFEVQLSQGLPFLGTLTRADWDVLLAVRNLFYEIDEGAPLDEVVVNNPPKRVLGGISVRF